MTSINRYVLHPKTLAFYMHYPSSASELQLCATATFSSFFTFSLTCSAGHIVCWRLLFVFQISVLQAYHWRYQFPPKTFSPSFICRNSPFIHTKSLHWIASDWMDQVFFLHRFFICNPHVFYELIMSMPPIFFPLLTPRPKKSFSVDRYLLDRSREKFSSLSSVLPSDRSFNGSSSKGV